MYTLFCVHRIVSTLICLQATSSAGEDISLSYSISFLFYDVSIVMPKLEINNRNSVRLSKFSKITSSVNDSARIPILCFYEQ